MRTLRFYVHIRGASVHFKSLVVALCTTRFDIKQDRLFTYNVTWRRVRAVVVAVENQ